MTSATPAMSALGGVQTRTSADATTLEPATSALDRAPTSTSADVRWAPDPLFTDPLGAPTDPTVVEGPDGTWWMFATQRRVDDDGPGVRWVHGTDIAVATSDDGGLTWTHRGVVDGLDPGEGRNTLWAPEVVFAEGRFHLFVSYITGVPEQWAGHERHILHHVSDDLVTWEYRGVVPLSSDYVIDACVAPTPDGYRMWFKDEAAGSTTWCADSVDLETWGQSRPVIEGRPHEGPNVFTLGGWHWMIVDEWRGQAVYRSDDLSRWTPDGHILVEPRGHHADVVTTDDEAWIFSFMHDVSPFGETGAGEERATRPASIKVAVARVVDGHLVCDPHEPVDLDLRRAARTR